jgi:hypothetical protein
MQLGHCSLFSVVFTPSPICDLNYHCIAGAGLPIQYPYDGRGFVGPQIKDECGPLRIQSSLVVAMATSLSSLDFLLLAWLIDQYMEESGEQCAVVFA